MAKKYWLMKSEPDVFSIDDLKRDRTTWWEGVRNYQARNFMMKEMDVGDEVLFYHSNTEPPGIFGTALVSKKAAPDPTQFDKKSEYYDPKATKEKPIWYCVEIKYKAKLAKAVSLEQVKKTNSLAKMLLVKKGMRLSVQPVTAKEYETIVKMGGK